MVSKEWKLKSLIGNALMWRRTDTNVHEWGNCLRQEVTDWEGCCIDVLKARERDFGWDVKI
jgi:hypothetical protein